MNGKAPFLLCPWEDDILDLLLERAIRDTRGDIGSAVFIFPHSRPERYLLRLLRQDVRVRRPLLAPRCLTVGDLFSDLRAGIDGGAIQAGMLDRVGLLLECARREFGDRGAAGRDGLPPGGEVEDPDDGGRAGDAAGGLPLEAERFFPWGLRLAALFEECFVQRRTPDNFHNTGGQVSPFAGALLSRLGHIFARYSRALEQARWSTPGFDALTVSNWLAARGELPPGPPFGGAIYVVGFHSLTRSEDLLLRHLWERHGARIVIHADAALTDPSGQGRPAHWSCRAFTEWARRWGASLEGVPAVCGRERLVRYYEGFDLHSQLRVLERELIRDGRGEEETAPGGAQARPPAAAIDTVVVLTDSALLMPTLHHLPRADINISMGYPLARSPLFRLLDTLLRLQEGRRGDAYYWRDLTELLRHPYIAMLRPETDAALPDGEAADASLRRELHRLEQALHRLGQTYTSCRDLLDDAYGGLAPQEKPSSALVGLLEEIIRVCLENFARPRRLRDLGQALDELCLLLLTRGKEQWRRFPIDAECLCRIMRSLVPELTRSGLAEESFTPSSLFSMLRRLMEAERVPFEAEPLVGLQVMGMLETRLLSFSRVVVLDAVEDALPGGAAPDPLLPESLRRELGLPSPHAREQVAAYHFFRLVRGAQDCLLLWQEGAFDPAGGKKKKSRFIEEMLWEEEKSLGRLLRPNDPPGGGARGGGAFPNARALSPAYKQDGPLRVIGSVVKPVRTIRRGVAVSPDIRALADAALERPLSASLLDAYLRCPAQFFYRRLTALSPADEIQEGDDPVGVGELIHEVLLEGYERRGTGRPLPGGEALAASLGPELTEILHTSPRFAVLARRLPADAFAMLVCAGETRLRRYLESQMPSTVLALEYPLNAAFVRGDLACTLTGKADRIDLRLFAEGSGDPREGVVILDYKTGRLPENDPSFWDDQAFWRRLGQGGEAGADALRELLRRVGSVQLPLYLLLHSLCAVELLPEGAAGADGAKKPALDAAWVALGEDGEEKTIFPPSFSPSRRAEAVEKQLPDLLHFLLRHMRESREMVALPGPHCDWCSCAKLCTVVT